MNRVEFAIAATLGFFISSFLVAPAIFRLAFSAAFVLVMYVAMKLTPKRNSKSMRSFQEVASTGDVQDPGSMLCEVEDRLIVLIHAAGHWYALDDVCTHDGGPLSEGPVDASEGTIACPRHGAKFDVKTGAALTMPATKPTVAHEVKVEGDQVFVKLSQH